jgi:hypothetical protein
MKKIIEYAVPRHFKGIIFSTHGQRAAGAREYPMLNNTMRAMAIVLLCIGIEKQK